MIAAPSTATSPGRSVFGRKKEKEAGKLPKEFLPGFWNSLGNEGGDAGSRQTEMPECVVKLISVHRDASCQHVLILFA
jgi:hypothetical protein